MKDFTEFMEMIQIDERSESAELIRFVLDSPLAAKLLKSGQLSPEVIASLVTLGATLATRKAERLLEQYHVWMGLGTSGPE